MGIPKPGKMVFILKIGPLLLMASWPGKSDVKLAAQCRVSSIPVAVGAATLWRCWGGWADRKDRASTPWRRRVLQAPVIIVLLHEVADIPLRHRGTRVAAPPGQPVGRGNRGMVAVHQVPVLEVGPRGRLIQRRSPWHCQVGAVRRQPHTLRHGAVTEPTVRCGQVRHEGLRGASVGFSQWGEQRATLTINARLGLGMRSLLRRQEPVGAFPHPQQLTAFHMVEAAEAVGLVDELGVGHGLVGRAPALLQGAENTGQKLT